MPKMNIERSITINAPIDKVHAIISDYHHWSSWSPWLIMEPETKVTVQPDGKYYEWVGNRTGAGNMTITSEKENSSVKMDLVFLKPWKSKAKVGFKLTSENDATKVSWDMQSSLPFFMFWMKKMMEQFVGMDYERGLRLLKDYAEDGETHSKLTFKGKEAFGGTKFIGIKTNCSKETIAKKMREDMPKLFELSQSLNIEITGPAFTQYHKWNMVKNDIRYTSGIPVNTIPENLPEGFYSGEIPAMNVYTLEHVGPYPHLGNAWTTMYTMQRNKEFAVNKKVHPFETYHNSPGNTPENELITKVHFPVV